MRLLLTRPEPDAQRTAAALRVKGHEAIIAPLLRIEAQIDVEIGAGPWAAVLVTSANAGPAIAFHERAAELRTLPVFAVGKRSAQTMTAAGFGNVRHSDGDVNDFTAFVAGELQPRAPSSIWPAKTALAILPGNCATVASPWRPSWFIVRSLRRICRKPPRKP